MTNFLPLFLFVLLLPSPIISCPPPDSPIPSSIPPPPSSSRILAASNNQPIRILFDYSGLSYADTSKGIYLKSVLKMVGDYLFSALKIDRRRELIAFNSSSCYTANIPLSYSSGVAADLAVFVTDKSDSSASGLNLEAWSTTCFIDRTINNRPVAGQLNILSDKVDPSLQKTRPLYQTLLHEITHILAFSATLYDYFIDSNGNVLGRNNIFQTRTVRGKATAFLVLPTLKSELAAHFGCMDVFGAEVEDEGSSASAANHFERRIFGDELMTSSSLMDSSYSRMTLALLKDSGWYEVDFSKADIYKYGKSLGCNFLTTPCIQNGKSAFPWYFTDKLNTEGCYYDFSKKGKSVASAGTPSNSVFNYFSNKIVQDIFADNCPAYYYYANGDCRVKANRQMFGLVDEEYGEDSRCLQGTLIKKSYSQFYNESFYRALCLKTRCSTGAQGGILYFSIGTNEYACPASGGDITIPGYEGTITCPPSDEFCPRAFAGDCPLACSTNGYCENGKCQCNFGFEEADCASKTCTTPATDCNGRGTCQEKQCTCSENFFGRSCEDYSYRYFCSTCSSNSDCYMGQCYCQELPNRDLNTCKVYSGGSGSSGSSQSVLISSSQLLLGMLMIYLMIIF